MKTRIPSWLLLASLAALGCSGTLGATSEDGRRPGAGADAGGASAAGGSGVGGAGGAAGPGGSGGAIGAGAAGSGAAPAPDQSAAGLLPLRLLTANEYNNTVHDLLGDATAPGDAFPGEVTGDSGFATVGNVSDVSVTAYMTAAEALAAAAVKSPATLAACAATTADDACAASFIASFGRRAFRRPLSAGDLASYVALFQAVRAPTGPFGYDFTNGLRVLVQALLQSPYFLYRWELDATSPALDGAVVALGQHQIASRLSYFLWATMPDEALLTAADAGELGSPAQVEAQARRMLGDPRAAQTIRSFHYQWLGLNNLLGAVKSSAYPDYNPALQRSMLDEVDAFTTDVILKGDGSLATLLTAPYSFLNAPLAKVYGVAGVSGDALVHTATDPTQRAGLLTMPAVLTVGANATEGNPILRGKLVREQFLCQPIPPPPAGIPPLSSLDNTKPIWERLAGHTKVEPCSSCHSLMDPIGFGFDNFDAIGGFITVDHNTAVMASGDVAGLDGADPTYAGPVQLVGLLAKSDALRSCVARQWLRFGFGHGETADDAASLAAASDAFVQSHDNIRELLVALTKTRSFLYRKPAAGEVSP